MLQYDDIEEPQAQLSALDLSITSIHTIRNRISRTVVGVVTLSGLVEQHAQTWFVKRPTT